MVISSGSDRWTVDSDTATTPQIHEPAQKSGVQAMNEGDHSKAPISRNSSTGSRRNMQEAQLIKLRGECADVAAKAYRLCDRITEIISSRERTPDTDLVILALERTRAYIDTDLRMAVSYERMDILNLALEGLLAHAEMLRAMHDEDLGQKGV